MKHLKWTIAGLIAGALTAAFTVGFDFEDQYRSNAVISVSPGVIAPPFANTRSIEMEQIRQRFVVNTLSVPVLVSMIQSHKLHQALWKRVPMQELVEKVRKDVRILPGSSEAIRISFMYPERKVAQDFVVDLIHRMISQDRMFRKQSLSAIIGFLRSETENARADWVKAENDARASESNGRPDSRLMLDVELARDRYRNGRNQIAEAERSLALEERKIGPALELVDPASLPVYPEKGPLLGLVTGGGVGGLAGLLASWAAGFLHRKPDEAIA